MSDNARLLLTLLLAAGLSLPTGWCCLPSTTVASDSGPRSCCERHSAPVPRPVEAPQPACCCATKVIIPVEISSVAADVFSFWLALPVTAVDEGPPNAGQDQPALTATGPPSRVLQCVWRC
ncbi:MAG: hypothetical protein ACT4QC_07610 [Planctomycetaceae bacterium]